MNDGGRQKKETKRKSGEVTETVNLRAPGHTVTPKTEKPNQQRQATITNGNQPFNTPGPGPPLFAYPCSDSLTVPRRRWRAWESRHTMDATLCRLTRVLLYPLSAVPVAVVVFAPLRHPSPVIRSHSGYTIKFYAVPTRCYIQMHLPYGKSRTVHSHLIALPGNEKRGAFSSPPPHFPHFHIYLVGSR